MITGWPRPGAGFSCHENSSHCINYRLKHDQNFRLRLISAYEDKILQRNDPGYHPRVEKIREKYGNTSFPSFISYILDNGLSKCNRTFCHVDGHWTPYYFRCSFCQRQYDVIGRMETFSEDLRFVLIQIGWLGRVKAQWGIFALKCVRITIEEEI